MATAKFNIGTASKFFITDVRQNLALLENPYIVFSNGMLSKSLLAEILAAIFNIEHTKGFLGSLIKKAEKGAIEKLLEDLINERKPSPTMMGSGRPIIIFANGIEKQCLFAMKVLKLRGLALLAAVNIRKDAGKMLELVGGIAEIKGSETYRDAAVTIFRPSKLRVVIGKEKTVITPDMDFKNLIKENAEIVVPVQDMPINDNRQIMDEGSYD